jgi:hypothetical protein
MVNDTTEAAEAYVSARDFPGAIRALQSLGTGAGRPDYEATNRGEPTSAQFSLARAFAGHAMVELIEQHDDAPSVYNERGYDEAYTDLLPSGSRIVYVDSTRDLPGMIELIEYTEEQEPVYDAIHRAASAWDGREPIRRTDR